jgi:hypothetical protein
MITSSSGGYNLSYIFYFKMTWQVLHAKEASQAPLIFISFYPQDLYYYYVLFLINFHLFGL